MNTNIQNQCNHSISTILYYARFFAILLVIYAHDQFLGYETTIACKVLQAVSCSAVSILFFLSGYWSHTNYSFGSSIKNRLVSLFQPWLFGCTVMYIFYSITGYETFSLVSYIRYVFLGHSIYWFLSALVLMTMLTSYFHEKKKLIIISTISILIVLFYGLSCQGWNLIIRTVMELPFYVCGILVRKSKHVLIPRVSFHIRLAFLASIITLLVSPLCISIGQINIQTFVYKVVCVFTIIILSMYCYSKLSASFSNQIVSIAKFSLPIYLFHMPFIGILNTHLAYFSFVNPFICLLFLYTIFKLIQITFNHIHLYFPLTLLGIPKGPVNGNE